MTIRPFNESDVASLVGLYQDSIHRLASPFYTPAQLAAWAPDQMDHERWKWRLASQVTLVAEQDGLIAGFATVDLQGHLDFLFTHPDFTRQGVATRLCQAVEARLRAGGVARMVTEASVAARPFFDRFGFVLEAEEYVECRGQRLRRFRMYKEIGGGDGLGTGDLGLA
jgi:putative acetyltransferase